MMLDVFCLKWLINCVMCKSYIVELCVKMAFDERDVYVAVLSFYAVMVMWVTVLSV